MGVLMNRENWLKNIEGAVFDLFLQRCQSSVK